MSHNVTMSGVKIKDLNAFGQVVRDLSKGEAKLVNPASNFRTYRGQDTTCDAKIEMPGKHDVGLKKNADGSYTPVFDPYAMSPIFKNPHGDSAKSYIGLLMQEYTLREAEYQAARNGYTPNRVQGANGVTTLELVPVGA